jgi:hypothetical protein
MTNFEHQEVQTAIETNRDKLEKEYFSATNLYKELT